MMDRKHMIKHAAWLAHETHCTAGCDNPDGSDIERIKAALPYLEERIRADERAQLAAGDAEACTSWLRYTLDTLGVSAGRSDDLAEELAALVGSFVEMKLRDEREHIAAWLRSLDSRSPIINRELAAGLIEKGVHREPR